MYVCTCTYMCMYVSINTNIFIEYQICKTLSIPTKLGVIENEVDRQPTIRFCVITIPRIVVYSVVLHDVC